MEDAPEFVELPETDTLDFAALPTVTKNNQSCRLIRGRYTELQRWIRGRSQ